MARELRQNTPRVVVVGPAVDETDGVTPITSVSSAGILDELAVWKANSSAPVAFSGAFIGSVGSGGMIALDLVSADVNTLGLLRFHLRDNDGFLNIWEDFDVVRTGYWDWKHGTAAPPGNVTVKGYASAGATPNTGNVTVKAYASAGATPNIGGVAVKSYSSAGVTPNIGNVTIKGYSSAGATPNIGAVTVKAYSSGGSTPLKPTTAGRTLDVSAGGEAGIDWANIGSPTTTVGLSGTTVKTATDVETDTADIQSRLPAALTGAGLMKIDLLAVNGNANSAAQLQRNVELTLHGVVDTGVFTPSTSTASSRTTFQADVLTMNSSSHIASAASFFIGRSMIFRSGALRGQRSAILAYEKASSQAKFTIDSTTSNPVNNIEFEIL